MSRFTISPELDHPAYHQALKLRGYNRKVTIFQAVSDADAAKLLKCFAPEWTRADHERLSQMHAAAAVQYEAEWGTLADEAALQTFGRPYRFTDYHISGIAREEFPEELKTKLRFAAHANAHHSVASRAHARAARYR